MHTYTIIQRRNQQVNRRHIKITYLLTAPEPVRVLLSHVTCLSSQKIDMQRCANHLM